MGAVVALRAPYCLRRSCRDNLDHRLLAHPRLVKSRTAKIHRDKICEDIGGAGRGIHFAAGKDWVAEKGQVTLASPGGTRSLLVVPFYSAISSN
jgi:hypothetical protein